MSQEETSLVPAATPKKETLWMLAGQLTRCEDLINLDDTTTPEEFRERYLTKVDNTYGYRRFIERLIDERKDMIARHKAELEALEGYLERYDKRIADTMKYFGIEVLSGHEVEIGWGKLNTAAIVPPRKPTKEEAESEATKPFVRTTVKTEHAWDKDAIKKAHLAKAPCPIEGTGVDTYRNLDFDVKRGIRK